MSVFDSLMVSIFSLSLVFLVLAFLYAIVLGFSKILSEIQNKAASETADVKSAVPMVETDENQSAPSISLGELKLVGVDDKTAAMIMAIVSHETSIPLSELCFKSIKAMEQS
jgi:Na+-transporting methylmalonyl-CoA/oxaloacetate decarboxylase gamma subunit